MIDAPDIVTSYARAQYDRRYGGTILVNGEEVACTLQCCHCGGHWIPVRGSKTVRGFCFRCNGPICGPCCVECVPAERQLEILEGTRQPGAVSVGVNGDVPDK
jgi:hypothetical protein